MIRLNARRAALLLAVSATVTACSGTAAPEPTEQTFVEQSASTGITTVTLSGFPLDRSLRGLADSKDIDAVLVVSDVAKGAARWNTADGKEPAYVTEGRNPTAEEAGTLYAIITPVTARVKTSLLGDFKAGDVVTLTVAGGTVGDVTMSADSEVAADLASLAAAPRLLVAGPVTGSTMDPHFVYSLGTGDRVKSLLASASASEPDFTIADLIKELAARK